MDKTSADQQKAELLTKYIRERYDSQWPYERSLKIVIDAKSSDQLSDHYNTPNGPVGIHIIMRETMLVNGRDVTGNLGSKTTFGNNSPILDNISSSTVNISSVSEPSPGSYWQQVPTGVMVEVIGGFILFGVTLWITKKFRKKEPRAPQINSH